MDIARSARRLVVLAAAVVALLAASCSSDDDAGAVDATVRPFADVQDSELAFEMDPADPSRALFHVTTTIPMICSITWGPTEELGNQNNSLSMDGSGIVQHDVVLPGAEAGEEYFFTVQGSDAEGNLYQSELRTVTIPETGSAVFPLGSDEATGSDEGGPEGSASPTTTDPAAAGDNVALDATVADVSSEFSDAFAAEQAIDGDLSTEWSTDGDGDDAFIELDLGSTRAVGAVEFVTRTMADESATTSRFTVTVDGEEVGTFDAATVRQRGVVTLDDVVGRMLRFDVESSSGGNTGAVEIRVFGPPPEPPTVTTETVRQR